MHNDLTLWWRANARNVSFETLYDSQFTSLTLLIIPNYPIIICVRFHTHYVRALMERPKVSFYSMCIKRDLSSLRTCSPLFPENDSRTFSSFNISDSQSRLVTSRVCLGFNWTTSSIRESLFEETSHLLSGNKTRSDE